MRRPHVLFALLVIMVTLRRASTDNTSSMTTAEEDADYEDYEEAPRKGRAGGGGRGLSTCPPLTLANGRVRLRSRGRIAKFMCRIGFQGIGKRFATCIRGHWNAQPPICISRGCPTFIPPANGRMSMEYRGALLNFACNPGFGLVGSRTLYCDGKEWNATAPNCEVSVKNPPLGCDFEFEYLCGWSQDPTHDFDWKRFNFVTPSGHVGTGPSHDHTLGEGRDGFYMYIEASSPRVENDTARLFSPVYGPSLTRSNACFRFWYHMYGATTGQLRIYVKPVSKDVSSIRPAFLVSGDQGNRWIMGLVHIDPLVEPFQVVVEGVRGPSYVSDSAIDDVQLLTGPDCGEGRSSSTIPDVDITVTTHGLASHTDGLVHEERTTTSPSMPSTVNGVDIGSVNTELASATEYSVTSTSESTSEWTDASMSSSISSTAMTSSSEPSTALPVSTMKATTDTTSSNSTTILSTTPSPSSITSPKMTKTTVAFLRTPSTTGQPTSSSSTTTAATTMTTSAHTSMAMTLRTFTAMTSTTSMQRPTTYSPTLAFSSTEAMSLSTTTPSTTAVKEIPEDVTMKVAMGTTSGSILATKTAATPTSTSNDDYEDDYDDDDVATVMSITTSTDLSNVINIFANDDDDDDGGFDVVQVPKRDDNRLPPPWTFMTRRPSKISSTITNDVIVASAAARTANDRVSIPTVTGLITVGVLSMAIVLMVARKFYYRNAYGRGRADTMSDDSDVRYLKDGEVRVEFGELQMRYVSGKDIISESM